MNIWVGYTIIFLGILGVPLWRLVKHSREAEERAQAAERLAHENIKEQQAAQDRDEENRKFVLTVAGSQVEDWTYTEVTRLVEDGWLQSWTEINDLDEIWVES